MELPQHPLLPWGWTEHEQRAWDARAAQGGKPGVPGRVVSEHKGGLFVIAEAGERHAVVPGRLRRAAEHGELPLPTVGDFVALGEERGSGAVPVTWVLPRRTVLARRAAGDKDQQQTMAANVDLVLLAAALSADL